MFFTSILSLSISSYFATAIENNFFHKSLPFVIFMWRGLRLHEAKANDGMPLINAPVLYTPSRDLL